MIIVEGDQRTPEWEKACLGSVGASSVSKIITTRGKRSTQRNRYFNTLMNEIISEEKEMDRFCSESMQEGINREQQTLDAFSIFTDLEIRNISHIKPFERAYYHCSPDSIVVGQEEGVEVKSVQEQTQIKRLRQNKLPTECILQCQMSLLASGWDLWYFFSYHPNQAPLLIEVERDENLISLIKQEVEIFIEELNNLTGRV